jgi:UDP-N-acetylmuramoyl-tripeptide--D-alanyl-D-alanine ligase
MAASVLSSKFNVHKTEGNYNNHLGLPITILQARKEHEIMILEMGMSHKGEIELLSSIAKPDYSIITNIGESHIENLGSKEGIALAKSEILLHTNINGCAFLPNNEFFNLMSSHYNGEIISFGEFPDSDLFFEDSKILNNTTNFLFYSKSSLSPIEFNLSIHGNHNILNSLSVISLSLKLGVSVENIQHSLSNLSITKMRFETTTHPSGCILINDTYNASPSSMKASIHTFIEAYGSKQKVVVLSDMLELGDFSEEFHREIGSFLKNKDVSLFTIGKFSKFISEEGNGTHFPSTDELNNFLQKFLDKDTAIFFKASRGMKLEKTVLSLV